MDGIALFVAAFAALIITWLSGYVVIPYLKKLNFGQTILDIGPRWHKSKEGTPTMGGVMFVLGVVPAVAVAFTVASMSDIDMFSGFDAVVTGRLFSGLIMALAMGLIGFADDFLKVVNKRNLGLTARQKLLLQFSVSAIYLFTLYTSGDTSTILVIPFIGQFDFGFFYYPLCVLGISFIVNSVNLTDGIDGLCTTITLIVSFGFLAVAGMLSFYPISLLSAAVAGSCIGFLIWNFNPAKVFMGDTGSFFLGGLVVALAFGVGLPILLLPMGIIYILESLSVVLQVISFKSTGKRIFKMSPIHHHFEMSGDSEVKIVVMFSVVQIIGVLIGVWAVGSL